MAEKLVSLKIKELKPGMLMGKTIINSADGYVIIKKGDVIDEEKINSIRKYFKENRGATVTTIDAEENIFYIDGEERYLPPKTSRYIKKVMSSENQQMAISAAVTVMHDARMGRPIDSKAVENSVVKILDSILGNEDAAVNLLNIKDFDDYTYTHSVNVSTISLLIASKLKLTREEFVEIGVGAMLHDLGKVKIPLEVLNKPDKLDNDEFEIMKKHPIFTYQLLKGNANISDISKYIAAEHHEKFDGTGYPRGLKGNSINFFARIVSIADVYDALTTDRVYRKAMKPYDAMKIIVSGSGTHFDPEMVRVFLKAVSIYPAGSHILLNTGETAVVEKVDSEHILRPDIIVIRDKNGHETINKIKLLDDSKRYIVEAVSINE
jgi:HD-GYP domain-containing protein (c-di-GMP phosphodiesterase class II)